MCNYSFIADDFSRRWDLPATWPTQPAVPPPNLPTRQQVEELIELLKAAKKVDDAMGQTDCEVEQKKQLLRQLAKHLGIEVEIP